MGILSLQRHHVNILCRCAYDKTKRLQLLPAATVNLIIPILVEYIRLRSQNLDSKKSQDKSKKRRLAAGALPRGTFVRVKTARGRKNASTRWLQRQLNDPYVRRAQSEGYRSRAAYKLTEINEKYKILKRGMRVVDLGAAPGGWTQVIANIVGEGRGRLKNAEAYKGSSREDAPEKEAFLTLNNVVAVDLKEMDPLPQVTMIQGDFLNEETLNHIKEALPQGQADAVLSDMAPSATGHSQTDHLKIMALVEEASLCAQDLLQEGGVFVAKIFHGADAEVLAKSLQKTFKKVSYFKPPSSRKDSAEIYLIAQGKLDLSLQQDD